jgi:hypothetical protein
MVYDEVRGVVLMFGGGCSDSGAIFGDTWAWDGTTWTVQASIGPSPRIGHGMVFDSGRSRVVLFGGYDGTQFYNDTWEWDGQAWALRSTTGPSARDLVAMAYDSQRGHTVLFSGNNSPADTWEWNGTEWSQMLAAGPPARFGGSMTYDDFRQRSTLFGGDAAGDTWEWDGLAWQQSSPPASPSPRQGAGMAFNSLRRRAVLYGGSSMPSGSPAFGDTWEWNGVNWSQLVGTGFARHGHAIAYDSTRDRLVMFGGAGEGTNCNGDTWEMTTLSAPSITTQPLPGTVYTGDPVSCFVVASGSGMLSYQWRRNGINLVEGGRISGSRTNTLIIVSVVLSDAGSYDVVVSNSCSATPSNPAILTVNCYANCDGSTAPPILTANDFVCFMYKFAVGDSYANCDGSTVPPILNANDFACFLNAFAAGCS